MRLFLLSVVVHIGAIPLGGVSDIGELQNAVSNKAVLDENFFGLSTAGLRSALSNMFGIEEREFDIHPEFALIDSSDATIVYEFLRRALVTALVEQEIQISERMRSWLSPFSVSACSSFAPDVLWIGNHPEVFRMVASRVQYSAGGGFEVSRATFSAKRAEFCSKFACRGFTR